jgi:hypothetical protein
VPAGGSRARSSGVTATDDPMSPLPLKAGALSLAGPHLVQVMLVEPGAPMPEIHPRLTSR